MTDDAELLRRYARERSEDAFGEFVCRHVALVYSAALRRLDGDAHSAADITQQVFIAAARRPAALARHPHLSGWLYASTRNAAINLMRDTQRRKTREQAAVTVNDALAGGQAAVDWTRLRPVLDATMDELSDDDREVVLLRFFGGFPFAELGERLRLSENAARMRADRALDRLRVRLARRGITSTAAALALALANEAGAAAPAGLAASVTTIALAGAAGGAAGGAATFLGFMSTTKSLIAVAALVVAAGVGSAVYEAGAAHDAKTALESTRRELKAAHAQSAVLRQQLGVSEQGAAAASARVAALEKELAAARGKATPAAPSGAATRAAEMGVPWTNPDYSRAYVAKYRAELRLKYAPLYRALGLSPEQIAQFEAALADTMQAVTDIWAAAGAQGVNTAHDSAAATTVAKMTSDPYKERNDKLRALLGDAGFTQFLQFDAPNAQTARDVVNSLAANMYTSETPLTAPQGEQLTQIIARNTRIVNTPMASDGGKPVYRITPETDWTAVSAQAQGLLSEPQLAVLRNLTEQQRLSAELIQVSSTGRLSTGSK
jgi:RNA polymerase sigma factor (sigma-70 family)